MMTILANLRKIRLEIVGTVEVLIGLERDTKNEVANRSLYLKKVGNYMVLNMGPLFSITMV